MRILEGDCVEVMQRLIAEGVQFDGAFMDPPYHLTSIVHRFGADTAVPARSDGPTGVYARAAAGFMGQKWDGGDVAFRPETWRLVYDLLKPGAYLGAFSHTRRYHRMACAIEDAGFVIQDMGDWMYGSGMPKSHNVSKVFDRRAGMSEERKRTKAPVTELAKATDGKGTRAKPYKEPICIAQKPVEGAIADNWTKYGTGLLNIDECRVAGAMDGVWGSNNSGVDRDRMFNASPDDAEFRSEAHPLGRWPALLVHDGCPEVVALFPAKAGQESHVKGTEPSMKTKAGILGKFAERVPGHMHGDRGTAARFFYSAKAAPIDRVCRCRNCGTRAMGELGRCCDEPDDVSHATVKPVDLIRWWLRLLIPPGGTVLDAFAGTGTTGIAAIGEGMKATLIELDPAHVGDIHFRLERVSGLDAPLFAGVRG
jgi:site-specific DNA-methyltransferase (adenine-specific)